MIVNQLINWPYIRSFGGGRWFCFIILLCLPTLCLMYLWTHSCVDARRPALCLPFLLSFCFLQANTLSSPPPSSSLAKPLRLPRPSSSPLHLSLAVSLPHYPLQPHQPPPQSTPHPEFMSSSDPAWPESLSVPIRIGHSWCREPSAITAADAVRPLSPKHVLNVMGLISHIF